MMNWYEQDLDLQEPDVKAYPTEGIKAKYKILISKIMYLKTTSS